MPAWSPEIANEFIRLAAADGQAFDQMQLQKLVYIAHGWALAMTGEPLTGDRPEAWDFGPMYRRLADALAGYGRHPVTRIIPSGAALSSEVRTENDRTWSELEPMECELIARIAKDYGVFSSSQLSALTRGDDAPWASVFGAGEGRFRDIPHALIRDQFVRLAQRTSDDQDHT